MKLGEIADVIRSKNAGVHYFTIDIMFHEKDTYQKVKNSGKVTAESLSAKYGLTPDDVEFFEYDRGNSFKLTMPRSVPAGGPQDYDLFGAQQHPPIIDIEVPVEA
jgi:hypothetical protein